jgi:hypothetical protein
LRCGHIIVPAGRAPVLSDPADGRLEPSDDSRWHAGDEGGRRNVVRHDSTRCDNGSSSDGHTGEDRCRSSDPHVRFERDWRGSDEQVPLVWLDRMTSGDQADLVIDHDLVCDAMVSIQ